MMKPSALSKYNIQVAPLTATQVEDALAVYRAGGWTEDSLAFVEAEIVAYLKGDVKGYIRQRFIVVLVEERIVGVAAWAPSMCSFSVYELSWATVLPEWRHVGINTIMLQERINMIRSQHGHGQFEVLVYTWDNPMYAQAGFSPLASYTQRFKDKQKCILLAKFEG